MKKIIKMQGKEPNTFGWEGEGGYIFLCAYNYKNWQLRWKGIEGKLGTWQWQCLTQ
jgi:hypothetical protein